MNYIWASLTLSLTFLMICLVVPDYIESGLTTRAETATVQTNFIVEVDGAGAIRLNGQKVGLLDDAGLIAIKLQSALKFHRGRAVVQLRFVGDATWGDLVGVVHIIEASGVDEIQIQDSEGKNSPLVTLRKRINPAKTVDLAVYKPNPLILVVGINADGVLSINKGEIGSLEMLIGRLKEILKEREINHAYKKGMETRNDIPIENRIEKTVFVQASRSQTVGHVLRLISLLKSVGANPVGLQLDDLPL